MAERPIYIPRFDGPLMVETVMIAFQWHAGMSIGQKQRSIRSLHATAIEKGVCETPLEVSSKSEVTLGVDLSAFNLTITTLKRKKTFTVETAYQSSKVFEHGGPFNDLLFGTSRAAKRDPRLKESGALTSFRFFAEEWPLEPKTAFYDWLYLNALHKNEGAVTNLSLFDAFTDIEFNPAKSINCQAYSVALYKSLQHRGLITDIIFDRRAYLDVISSFEVNNARENTNIQPRLV